MIKDFDIANIKKLLNNKEIIYSKLLSESFGINCVKVTTIDNISYVVKYYKKNNNKFNAIKSELNNLIFFNKLNFTYFPKVFIKNDNYLIMSYINHNSIKPKEANKDLVESIASIHSTYNSKFGFDYDTQIGGLSLDNSKTNNWIEFYRDKRLLYIHNLINLKFPMDSFINNKIENLASKLHNFIPQSPKASLLHGDLWEGNILFNNEKLIGFIDPGAFFGHNELEISYLTWFNPDFIKNGFLKKYNEFIKINEEYNNYEPVYQLYHSLLNVYLWDRSYIEDVKRLLIKIKI